MNRELREIEKLVETGVLEPVPDVDPPKWRFTEDGQKDWTRELLHESHATVHQMMEKVHSYVDAVSFLLERVKKNEPFSQEEVVFLEKKDESVAKERGTGQYL